MNEIKDIFLGGTCNNSTWRDELIKYLERYQSRYTYFNPVVDDWTPDCQAEENRQKENCKIKVFCITPKMTGVFSIAELVESAIVAPDKTYFVIRRYDDDDTWTESQRKSLKATRDLCEKYGAHYYISLTSMAQDLAHRSKMQ